ncbi:MAG: transposase [Sandaracinaceae bacterium]|nr:transposase [Sandaracinaceae bacterium]
MRRALFETRWHVYAKAPFAGAQQVFAYLGRYTHRVGISNARLIRYDGEAVTFATKDGKSCTLHAVDFLARLLRHTLPRGFHKIRHAGLVSTSHVRSLTLARAQAALGSALASARGGPVARASPHAPGSKLMALALSRSRPVADPRCGTPLLVLPLPTEAGPQRLDSS